MEYVERLSAGMWDNLGGVAGSFALAGMMEGAFSSSDAEAALSLLRGAGKESSMVALGFERGLEVVKITPADEGYCYLHGFDGHEWPEVARVLGPYPRLSDVRVEMAARDADESRLRLHLSGQGLHADGGIEAGGAVRAVPVAEWEDLRVGGNRVEPARLVSVDVPDPDNFATVAAFLRDCVADGVVGHVSLVARPVDFAVVSYGPMFSEVCKGLGDGLKGMLRPVEVGNDERARGKHGWLFQPDRGFESFAVAEDTELYMDVCALRMRRFLLGEGFSQQDFILYTCPEDRASVKVAVRHAAHKQDYLYGFPADEYALVVRDIEGCEAVCRRSSVSVSEQLREVRRRACEKYLSGTCRCAVRDVRTFSSSLGVEAFVGGPFTHVAALMAAGVKFQSVTAMAGAWDERVNLLGKQFNLAADPTSAQYVLDHCAALLLVPTDVVKVSEASVVVDNIRSASLRMLYERWAGRGASVHVFDWLAYKLGRSLGAEAESVRLSFPEGHTVVSSGEPNAKMYRGGMARVLAMLVQQLETGDI